MSQSDLRILALADTKTLPSEVQDVFDHWRIWKARDVVAATVRRRMGNQPTLAMYLERLEAADTEETIFQGLYTVAEVVDVYRAQTGLHSDYIVLIMSEHLNPWGVIEFQRDFANPMQHVVEAAQILWQLCQTVNVDVPTLLKNVKDPLLAALNDYYEKTPLA